MAAAAPDAAEQPKAVPLSELDMFFVNPRAKAIDEIANATEDEKAHARHLAKVTRSGNTQLFWNYEAKNKKNGYGVHAKGYATRVSGSIPLQHFVEPNPLDGQPVLRFSPRWGARICVMDIPEAALPEGLTEAEMTECMKRLCKEIDENSSLDTLTVQAEKAFEAGAPYSTADTHRWEPFMGTNHGQFFGVFRKKGVLRGQRRQYYIALHTDAGVYGEALCAHAIENKERLTLVQFAECAEMRYVEELSCRNARRLLARIVHALGLHREHIKFEDDTRALINEDEHEAYPEMVAKEALRANTLYNFFHRPISTSDTLVYYAGASNLLRERSGGKRCVAQLMGPQKGVALYELDPAHDYTSTSTSVVVDGGATISHAHRNIFAAFPVSMGRPRDAAGDAQQQEQREILEKTATKLGEAYIWPDRIGNEMHPAFAAYNNAKSYEEGRNEFMLGSSAQNSVRLEPVAVVIPRAKPRMV